MQTLVICIDRDDDLGVKAGVSGPVIGREANLEAALKLASSDPEDSDINTIFGGINTYDSLISEKIDAGIVSIAGDKNVGIISDRKISEQLDRILNELRPESVILISDGAEDESILPLIQSRIKVDSVRRIIVKQHENLESTYYIIKQAFNDPKISHTFFVPIGLAFLIYAISLYARHPEVAVIAVTAAIGIYMLFRGTGLDDSFNSFKYSMISSLQGGKITFVMYLAAIVLSIVGTIQGGVALWDYYNQEIMVGYLILLVGFIKASIWWYVVSAILINTGKIVDLHLANENIGRYWSHPFFIIASGILLWAGSTYVLVISETLTEYPLLGNVRQLLFFVLGAIFIAIIGAWLSAKSPRGSTSQN